MQGYERRGVVRSGGRPHPLEFRDEIDVSTRNPPIPPVTFFIPPLHNPEPFGITNRVEDK
jgi:hypothetical protein